MPRTHHRIINSKSREDLKLLLEKLVVDVEMNGGLSTFDTVDRQLLLNLFSFYKKINDLTQEEVNIVWETAKMMMEKTSGEDVDKIIDEEKSEIQRQSNNVLEGNYWIFPGSKGKYIKCDDNKLYAIKHGQDFIDALGIDPMDYFHAITSEGLKVVPLILSAGGIIAMFSQEDGQKVGKFKLCQCSLPWLKGRLKNMPIVKSYLHVLDPTQPVDEDSFGVTFIYRRPLEALVRPEDKDGAKGI